MDAKIENAINKMVFERDGQKYISLGNSRLDFSKEYLFFGFTDKTVKLGWMNGRDIIKCHGKVEQRHDYHALYTERWSFIEHLKINN